MAAVRSCMCSCQFYLSLNKCSKFLPVVNGFRYSNSRTYSAFSYQKVRPLSYYSTWLHKDFHRMPIALLRPNNEAVCHISPELLHVRFNSATTTTEQDSSKKEEEKKKFSKRMKYSFIGFGAVFTSMACLLVYEWGPAPKDELGNALHDEYSSLPTWKAYVMRTYNELLYYNKMIKEPSREKLLPDPLTEPYYQPPYTLVLEMTGILVHPDWTYKTGWRFKKRPGVEFFLQQVGPPLYEVVIYTAEQGVNVYPILDSLDPNGFIMYRLFRDATRYQNGTHVKDLSCLNRDLSKVIYIDWNEKAYQLNPDNAFKLKRWVGEDEDRSLLDLAIFLRTIATTGVEDVRTVLEFYSKFDDPLEAFKENHRKLQKYQASRFPNIFPYKRFRQPKKPKTGGPKLIPSYRPRPNKNRNRRSWRRPRRRDR